MKMLTPLHHMLTDKSEHMCNTCTYVTKLHNLLTSCTFFIKYLVWCWIEVALVIITQALQWSSNLLTNLFQTWQVTTDLSVLPVDLSMKTHPMVPSSLTYSS